MSNVPNNPYPNERDLTVYSIASKQARNIIVVFGLLLAVPPLMWMLSQMLQRQWTQLFPVKVLSWTPKRGDLMSHLHAMEKSLDTAPYAKTAQQQVQWLMTAFAAEGCRKTFIGHNGWLFFQPELDALTGYGPILNAPFSIMKDPTVAKLKSARQCVAHFATQLKERGVKLMLVPIPVKATIYPEHITGYRALERQSAVTYQDEAISAEAPVFHADEGLLFDELRAAGVDVVDVVPAMLQLKEQNDMLYRRQVRAKVPDAVKREVYLKQDTHWTYDTMQQIAKALADHIRKTYPGLAADGPRAEVNPRAVSEGSLGDLVKLLGLPSGQTLFGQEMQTYVSLEDSKSDPRSSIALLGDSFVNIFDDPALGFAPTGSTKRLKAGFAQYLSLYLGTDLDVVTENGGGATSVRARFAARKDDEVRAKKLVVWVLSARDLLLTAEQGRDAGVTWKDVTFNPERNPPARIEPMLPPKSN
ncbi:MAG: hypothetical protein JNJ83_12050 [Verrucomicrobiaceae bacterium]|nr:hypothetical protein [Verrucomicrobiaceae bacterium]